MRSSEMGVLLLSLPDAAGLLAESAFLGIRRRLETAWRRLRNAEAESELGEEKGAMSITSDLIRGHTETIILAQLAEKDSYGYEINKTIQEVTEGAYELKEATLYSAFRRLEGNGMIRSYWGDQTTGARRRYYTITDAGREQLRQNRAEWKRSKQLIDRMILGGE